MMINPLHGARATPQPAGLIDTLQAGFQLVNRHAWLLLIPVAIDVLLWLGPQLTIGPLLERLIADAAAMAPTSSETAVSVDEQAQALIKVIRQSEGLTRYNLLSLLAVPLLGLPSFSVDASGRGLALPVDSLTLAAGLALLCIVVGLSLAALYYGLLGQIVREGQLSLRSFLLGFSNVAVRLTGLFGLLLAVAVAVGLPAGFVASLPDASASFVKSISGSLLFGVLLWAWLYLFFVPEALYVSGLSPFSAIYSSIRVVRHNFWSALAMIGLITVIGGGLSIVWNGAASTLHVPGVVVAILGQIYISTGLAAASMTYYKERLDRLPRIEPATDLE